MEGRHSYKVVMRKLWSQFVFVGQLHLEWQTNVVFPLCFSNSYFEEAWFCSFIKAWSACHTKYPGKLLMREIFLCSQFLLSTFPPFCEMVSRFGWQSWINASIRHSAMHNPSVLYGQYCCFVGSYPSWWTLLILDVSRVTVCLSWNSVPHLRWLDKSGIWH